MKIDKIIQNEIITLLEKAYYELNMRQGIVTRLIELHQNDESFLQSPLFKKYEDNYRESYVNYEIIKNQFTDFLTAELKASNELYNNFFDWQIISFALNKVRITFND